MSPPRTLQLAEDTCNAHRESVSSVAQATHVSTAAPGHRASVHAVAGITQGYSGLPAAAFTWSNTPPVPPMSRKRGSASSFAVLVESDAATGASSGTSGPSGTHMRRAASTTSLSLGAVSRRAPSSLPLTNGVHVHSTLAGHAQRGQHQHQSQLPQPQSGHAWLPAAPAAQPVMHFDRDDAFANAQQPAHPPNYRQPATALSHAAIPAQAPAPSFFIPGLEIYDNDAKEPPKYGSDGGIFGIGDEDNLFAAPSFVPAPNAFVGGALRGSDALFGTVSGAISSVAVGTRAAAWPAPAIGDGAVWTAATAAVPSSTWSRDEGAARVASPPLASPGAGGAGRHAGVGVGGFTAAAAAQSPSSMSAAPPRGVDGRANRGSRELQFEYGSGSEVTGPSSTAWQSQPEDIDDDATLGNWTSNVAVLMGGGDLPIDEAAVVAATDLSFTASKVQSSGRSNGEPDIALWQEPLASTAVAAPSAPLWGSPVVQRAPATPLPSHVDVEPAARSGMPSAVSVSSTAPACPADKQVGHHGGSSGSGAAAGMPVGGPMRAVGAASASLDTARPPAESPSSVDEGGEDSEAVPPPAMAPAASQVPAEPGEVQPRAVHTPAPLAQSHRGSAGSLTAHLAFVGAAPAARRSPLSTAPLGSAAVFATQQRDWSPGDALMMRTGPGDTPPPAAVPSFFGRSDEDRDDPPILAALRRVHSQMRA